MPLNAPNDKYLGVNIYQVLRGYGVKGVYLRGTKLISIPPTMPLTAPNPLFLIAPTFRGYRGYRKSRRVVDKNVKSNY